VNSPAWHRVFPTGGLSFRTCHGINRLLLEASVDRRDGAAEGVEHASQPSRSIACSHERSSESPRQIVTPEYNRSIPGALKNAIDWASRPYGTNAFTRKPSAVIGTSPGKIGTAVAQQHLRMAEFHGFIARVYTVLPRNT
jgi:hypothetical protein